MAPRTQVKGNALFWLAQRAGQKAVGTITAAIENDPDTEVKKKAVFALSQLPKDEGVPLLIQQARTNKNPVVRKQAMFWLGQIERPAGAQVLRRNPAVTARSHSNHPVTSIHPRIRGHRYAKNRRH